MMMILFLFFLLTVSLGRGETDCPQRFQVCTERHLTMQRAGMNGCSVTTEFLDCLEDVTRDCLPQLTNVVKKYQGLVQEGCRRGSTLFGDMTETVRCISRQKYLFQHCQLEGEFENVAEICSSVGGLIDCYRRRTRDVCGITEGEVFEKMFKPVSDYLGECKNSTDFKDTTLNSCPRELLKCERRLLTRTDYTCAVFEKNARCYVDVIDRYCYDLEGEFKILKIIFRGYMEQVPDYCNPESDFRQNLEKSSFCVSRSGSSAESCFMKYEEGMMNAVEGADMEKRAELQIKVLRIIVEALECLKQKLRNACGKEAEFVVTYVLRPLEEGLDENCIQLTGERCNGAVEQQCSIVLLILSIAFILLKKNE